MADADIEPQGIELGDWPKRVQIDLRTKNDVFLRLGRNRDRSGGAGENRGTVFGEVDVVVVLDAQRGTEPELDGTDLQIVGNFIERLAARFGCGFTSE